jgi:tetratricopeptide (TPR) repeat protein
MLVDNLSQAVLLHYDFGDLAAGEACAIEASRLSDRMGNVWGQTNSRLYFGHIQLERGRIGAAIETMRSAIRLGDISRHPGALVGARTDLALLLADLGAFDQAAELLAEATSIAGEMGTWIRAYPIAAQARLALLRGERSEARAALTEARQLLRPAGLQWFAPILIPLLEAELNLAEGDAESALSILTDLELKVKGIPARPFLPEVLRQSAAALVHSGRAAEAVEALRRARLEAQSMGATWRLLPVLVDLSRILEMAGDRAASKGVLEEAKTVGRQVMDQVPPGERWRPFKNHSDVQAVLAEIASERRPGAGSSGEVT